MKKILIAILGSALLLCGNAMAKTAEMAASVVQARHPQVEAVPAGQRATQVFMDLVNTGNRAHTVIAALSPLSKETQLHKTVKVDGKAQMRQVSRIKIKAHNDRDLHQGGFHVMLMGLNQQLKAGQAVPVTLVFADGSDMQVQAMVAGSSRLG